jgi:hypothetical protein
MIKQIGVHRVRCGDIFDDLGELFMGEKADLFYCDPPWGNLNYWQTLNAKMTGAKKKDTDLAKFLLRLATVAYENTSDDAVVFVEYGMKWKDQLSSMFVDFGFAKIGEGTMAYGSPKRPNAVLVFDKHGSHDAGCWWGARVDGMSGYAAVCAAVEPFSEDGMTICDPCCGLGYTARFAVEHNLRFFGNELNAKRLEKTIARLS